jgi:hypothetical protein
MEPFLDFAMQPKIKVKICTTDFFAFFSITHSYENVMANSTNCSELPESGAGKTVTDSFS